jgi:hypothetical protein
MNINSLMTPIPYGLMELDEAGTVLHYKPEDRGLFVKPEGEIVGSNFFTDIAAIAGAKDFQHHIKEFRRGHAPAQSFTYIFELKHRRFPVRVLLARTHERSTEGGAHPVESVFVHIRPQADRAAA